MPRLTRIALTLTAGFIVAAPTSMVFAATDKSDIPQPAVLSKEVPAQGATRGLSPAPAGGNADAAGKASENSTLYWYDGDRKRMLSLDSDTLADFGSNPKEPATEPRMIDQTTTSQTKAQSGVNESTIGVSPMFKDASSGQYAGALPGGVMVRTLRPMNIDTVMGIARAFGSSVLRPIGSPTGAANGAHDFWLFEAAAGIATLELANRIHESGQVSSAAPNWWKPRQRK